MPTCDRPPEKFEYNVYGMLCRFIVWLINWLSYWSIVCCRLCRLWRLHHRRGKNQVKRRNPHVISQPSSSSEWNRQSSLDHPRRPVIMMMRTLWRDFPDESHLASNHDVAARVCNQPAKVTCRLLHLETNYKFGAKHYTVGHKNVALYFCPYLR